MDTKKIMQEYLAQHSLYAIYGKTVYPSLPIKADEVHSSVLVAAGGDDPPHGLPLSVSPENCTLVEESPAVLCSSCEIETNEPYEACEETVCYECFYEHLRECVACWDKYSYYELADYHYGWRKGK